MAGPGTTRRPPRRRRTEGGTSPGVAAQPCLPLAFDEASVVVPPSPGSGGAAPSPTSAASPSPSGRPARRDRQAAGSGSPHTPSPRASRRRGTARQGEPWPLDDRTRAVGLAGIQAARAALDPTGTAGGGHTHAA